MGFEEIYGQEEIIRVLRSALVEGAIAHAYIFSGPAGSGKKKLAGLFAEALNCEIFPTGPCGVCLSCRKAVAGNHPDIHWLFPDGKSTKIEQVRQLKKAAALQPLAGRYQVFILAAADSLTTEAANSLLKILEEPSPSTIFLLLAENPSIMPTTVTSRCQAFTMRRLGPQALTELLDGTTGLDSGLREAAIRLAGGIPGRALATAGGSVHLGMYNAAAALLDEISGSGGAGTWAEKLAAKEDLPEVLDGLLSVMRDVLVLQATGDSTGLIDNGQVVLLAGLGKRLPVGTCRKILEILLRLQKNLHSPVNARLALEQALRHMKEAIKNADSSGNSF